jgi:hypothetical protein
VRGYAPSLDQRPLTRFAAQIDLSPTGRGKPNLPPDRFNQNSSRSRRLVQRGGERLVAVDGIRQRGLDRAVHVLAAAPLSSQTGMANEPKKTPPKRNFFCKLFRRYGLSDHGVQQAIKAMLFQILTLPAFLGSNLLRVLHRRPAELGGLGKVARAARPSPRVQRLRNGHSAAGRPLAAKIRAGCRATTCKAMATAPFR